MRKIVDVRICVYASSIGVTILFGRIIVDTGNVGRRNGQLATLKCDDGVNMLDGAALAKHDARYRHIKPPAITQIVHLF